MATYGDLGDVVKSCMRPKSNNSKAEINPNLTYISTVILFDNDKNDPTSHIQFGTINYKDYKKRKTSPNEKGKAHVVYEFEEIVHENAAKIMGSNYKRTQNQVTHVIKVVSLIT